MRCSRRVFLLRLFFLKLNACRFPGQMPAFAAVAFTLGIHEVVLQKAQKPCYNGSGTSEGVYSTETVTQNGVSIAVISGSEKRVKNASSALELAMNVR